jgi:hypothetical protein
MKDQPMATPCLSRTCLVRFRLFAAAILVIAAGLALRAYGYAFGLPFTVVKYGGSVLWGTMVYLLLAALLAAAARVSWRDWPQ